MNEVIELKKILILVPKKWIVPTSRQNQIHDFTKDELNIYFDNLNIILDNNNENDDNKIKK